MDISLAIVSDKYFPFPLSWSPLPHNIKHGLAVVASFALFSALSAFSVLVYITWRLVKWKRVFANQPLLLIYQLLIADLFQSVGFSLSLYWYSIDAILAPSIACRIQGAFINLGDLASGMFVLVIAMHTYYSVTVGKRMNLYAFCTVSVCVWILAATLTIVGPAQHGNKFFVRAGSWCWISQAYDTERLVLHYLWVFLAEFGSIVIYAILFVHLHRQIAVARRIGIHVDALSRVASAQRYMLLYPIVYVCLTLPLAIARMVTSAGHTVANTYLLAAGGLLCSCGWVDVVVYSLTRNVFVPERRRPSDHDGAASRRLTRTRSSRDASTARTSDTLIGDDDHDDSMYSAAVPLQDLEALTKQHATDVAARQHISPAAAPFPLPTLSSPISAMTLDSLASTTTAPYDSTSNKHDSTTKLAAPAAAAAAVSVSTAGADADDAPDPSASDASLAPLVVDQHPYPSQATTMTTPTTPHASPTPASHPLTAPASLGNSHHRTRRPHSVIRNHALHTLALATLHRRNPPNAAAANTPPSPNPISNLTTTSPPTSSPHPSTTTKATTRWSTLHTGLAAANLTPPPPPGAAVRATREVSVTRSPRQAGEYVCEYAGAGVFDGGGGTGEAVGGFVRRGGGGGSRRAWWLAGS